jgi:hypothetical protein
MPDHKQIEFLEIFDVDVVLGAGTFADIRNFFPAQGSLILLCISCCLQGKARREDRPDNVGDLLRCAYSNRCVAHAVDAERAEGVCVGVAAVVSLRYPGRKFEVSEMSKDRLTLGV